MATKFFRSKFWIRIKKLNRFWLALAIAFVPALCLGIILSGQIQSGAGVIIALFLCLHSACFGVAMTDTQSKIACALPIVFGFLGRLVKNNSFMVIILLCFWQFLLLIFISTVIVSFFISPIYLFLTGVKR